MLNVTYERIIPKKLQQAQEAIFPSLLALEEWIFGKMDDGHANFCVSDSKPWNSPDTICFSPQKGGEQYWIREIEEDGRVIFTDGKYTPCLTFWNQEMKDWAVHCWERQCGLVK